MFPNPVLKKKKKKPSILRPKERKTSSPMQLKLFFCKVDANLNERRPNLSSWKYLFTVGCTCLKFLLQLYFWKIFILKLWSLILLKPALAKTKISKYFEPERKKNLSFCSWKYFFMVCRQCVKFLLQNVLLKIFSSQTAIFDLHQTGLCETKSKYFKI